MLTVVGIEKEQGTLHAVGEVIDAPISNILILKDSGDNEYAVPVSKETADAITNTLSIQES